MSKVNSDYSNAIAERIKTIMQIAGLEILGISKLTGISDSHIYSLLNGRRNLTDEVAKIIRHSLEFDGMLIFKLNKDVPSSIGKSLQLIRFKEVYKHNTEYFLDTKIDRKGSAFIEYELLPTPFFEEPRYTWEVQVECKLLKKNYTSNEVNRYLKYLVVRKLLKSEKRKITRRKGTFGERVVDVFWK